MGYESKVFIVDRYEVKRGDGTVVHVGGVEIVALRMSKCDIEFHRLFTDAPDYKIYEGESDDEITEDKYGEPLKSAKIKTVYNWLLREKERSEQYGKDGFYRRYALLLALLESFMSKAWKGHDLRVVHYGY